MTRARELQPCQETHALHRRVGAPQAEGRCPEHPRPHPLEAQLLHEGHRLVTVSKHCTRLEFSFPVNVCLHW